MLHQCNVIDCCAWNYTPVKTHSLRISFSDFSIFTRLHPSKPSIWRRGFMHSSVTSHHLVYRRLAILFATLHPVVDSHAVTSVTGTLPGYSIYGGGIARFRLSPHSKSERDEG